MDGKPPGEAESIARKLEKIGVDVARRHVFLCADRENPKCADAERAMAAWTHLKDGLKRRGLSEKGASSDPGRLPPDLRRGADRRRLPRRGLVPGLRSAGPRPDHGRAPRRRPTRRRARHRPAPAAGRRRGLTAEADHSPSGRRPARPALPRSRAPRRRGGSSSRAAVASLPACRSASSTYAGPCRSSAAASST